MKTRSFLRTAAVRVVLVVGTSASLSTAHADMVDWSQSTYAPTAAQATQPTPIQTLNGVTAFVQFSNASFFSTAVPSPAAGSYAATASGNTNAVYANGGTTGQYALQMAMNFSTSTSVNTSGTYVNGASDTVTVSFSQPVANVSFSFFDVDNGTVSGGAYNDYIYNISGSGSGGTVTPGTTLGTSLTPGADNEVYGNGFLATANNAQNAAGGNATVSFGSTPISSFEFTYGDNAAANSTHSPLQIAALGNISYSVPEPSTWAMMGLGLALAALVACRKRAGRRLNVAVSLVASTLFAFHSTCQAQTFQNGSFETTTATGALGTGSTAVAGWTTQVGNGTNANVYEAQLGTEGWIPNPESGNYCVQLDGSQTNSDANFLKDGQAGTPNRDSITQTFTLQPGTYTLSWWINNEIGTNKGGTSGALVFLSGVASGALNYAEYTVTNPVSATAATSTWKNYTDTFRVTNGTAPITLAFADDPNTSLSNYTRSSNISIDNVQINTVPEPSAALFLMSVGIAWGVWGWVRRRRGRAGVVAGAAS